MADAYYKNFEAAFLKLEEFSRQFKGSEIERAGIIQAFEFTFEQAWKALQKKAGSEGVVFASPKKAFEWALAAGLILSTEEKTWIDILSDRNLTSHTYRQAMALQVSENVMKTYLPTFRVLLERMVK